MLSLYGLFIFATLIPSSIPLARENALDVYIFGGAGDLARRYLWKGFFKLFENEIRSGREPKSIRFFGTGRKSASEICDNCEPVNSILQDVIICSDDEECQTAKKRFMNQSKYLQIKTDDHYEKLCKDLEMSSAMSHEIIFYLSVPPTAYIRIIERLSTHCDLRNPRRQHKFVFEKPFGSDYDSAVTLSSTLWKHLDESQIFRVDHYLGKTTVSHISRFRQENPGIEKLLNATFVKRVEIVAKETVGVGDRIPYYDGAGVIRDMLQSHLTEIFRLLVMNISDEHGKLSALDDLRALERTDVLLGQYTGYDKEVLKAVGQQVSETPTFAVTKLLKQSPRWKSVPFILLSGKKMDERVGYARILFKNRFSSQSLPHGCESGHVQLVFYIGHGKLNTPAMLVSRQLPAPINITGWMETNKFDDKPLFGTSGKCFRIFVPNKTNDDAYTFLISKIHQGDHSHFVPTQELLKSWQIWTPLLKDLSRSSRVHKYPAGSSERDVLKFRITPYGLDFVERPLLRMCLVRNIFLKRSDTSKDEGRTLLGYPILTGSDSFLAESLANELRQAVLSAGSNDFHVALSGGSSPISFYNFLVTNMSNAIPWERLHFWQVDERCSAEHANFDKLKSLLIDKLPIDKDKVHPMVDFSLRDDECSQRHADLYEEEIISKVMPSGGTKGLPSLDFVVLGMGIDGHTASLFPGSPVISVKDRLVMVGDASPGAVSPKRMTLTLNAINNAKQVAILVKGKQKCETLKDITNHCSIKRTRLRAALKYPVCGVAPKSERLRWYVTDATCLQL